MVSRFVSLLWMVLPGLAWGQAAPGPTTDVVGQLQVLDAAAFSNPELVGVAKISGTETDHTGLTNVLGGNTPHNQFGGISGIDWIPGTDRFRVLSDRGPQDGAVDFFCRFHELELQIDPSAATPVVAKVLSSSQLRNSQGLNFVGASGALAPSAARAHRLDPEAVRVDRNGFNWVSDEYGPHLFCFDSAGQQLQEFPMPGNLRVAFSSANPDEEDQRNICGRRSNRGMEGLAITPSGCSFVGLMQSPLIQDGYPDEEGKKVGYHSRLVRFDLKAGRTQQFIYRQEHESHKMHEILAIDEQRFLVIEQDGKPGAESSCKRVFLIDLAGATDVSAIASLPGRDLPPGLVPVRKTPVLDLLDKKYGLGETMPEKVEGLSWGKTLPDGRKTLVVATDNDFRADQATVFYVFAFPATPAATVTRSQTP